MIRVIQILACFAAATLVIQANYISKDHIQIFTPLTEDESRSIRALETWPQTRIYLQEANDAVLESLASIAELQDLIIKAKNCDITTLAPISQLKELRN